MTQFGRIIEEEKRQALAQVIAEKEQAEAEKKEALAQIKSEKQKIINGLLRKNFSSEEIISMVSGFSQEDIETMRARQPCSFCKIPPVL